MLEISKPYCKITWKLKSTRPNIEAVTDNAKEKFVIFPATIHQNQDKIKILGAKGRSD